MTSRGHVDQAAVNAAFTTGIYLLITQIITTTTYLRAASLSGASRRTLALSTYVLSAVVIAIASVIWWVLALAQTHIFFLGSLEYPLGVDSWLIVVVAWIACDGAGRLIGAASRHGRGPWTVALNIIVATVLGIAGIAGSGHLAGPHARSQVRLPSPRCTLPSGCSASSLSQLPLLGGTSPPRVGSAASTERKLRPGNMTPRPCPGLVPLNSDEAGGSFLGCRTVRVAGVVTAGIAGIGGPELNALAATDEGSQF